MKIIDILPGELAMAASSSITFAVPFYEVLTMGRTYLLGVDILCSLSSCNWRTFAA